MADTPQWPIRLQNDLPERFSVDPALAPTVILATGTNVIRVLNLLGLAAVFLARGGSQITHDILLGIPCTGELVLSKSI